MITAGHLAGSEEVAHVGLDIIVLLSFDIIPYRSLVDVVDIPLIEVDDSLGVKGAGLEKLDGGLEVEKE